MQVEHVERPIDNFVQVYISPQVAAIVVWAVPTPFWDPEIPPVNARFEFTEIDEETVL